MPVVLRIWLPNFFVWNYINTVWCSEIISKLRGHKVPENVKRPRLESDRCRQAQYMYDTFSNASSSFNWITHELYTLVGHFTSFVTIRQAAKTVTQFYQLQIGSRSNQFLLQIKFKTSVLIRIERSLFNKKWTSFSRK